MSFDVTPDPRVLHTIIEEGQTKLLSQEWCGSILIEHTDEATGLTALGDILQYTTKAVYNNHVFRFSPILYPLNPDGLQQLKDDIKEQSRVNCGAEICVATVLSNPNRWFFRCKHARIYDGEKVNSQTKTVLTTMNYRKSSLHNDRKNCRPSGKELSRKSSTHRRLSKDEDPCPFSLTIFEDDKSFFVKGGTGCKYHNYHLRLDPTSQIRVPTNAIPKEEASLIASVGSANASVAVGRNLYFVRGGSILSKSQVSYIFKTCNDDHQSSCETHENMNPTDSMIEFLKDAGSSFCVLYHHQGSSELRENMPTKPRRKAPPTSLQAASYDTSLLYSSNEPSGIGLVHESHLAPTVAEANGFVNSCSMMLPPSELQELAHDFSNTTRLALDVDDQKDLVLACAWVIPKEVAQFKLFPHVLHVDTTSATNTEQRPLLTVTGRDSSGEMFTVLRAFLPNERAWVFRWIFQHAFPTLLQRENLTAVKMIVTDGDSQEISQLDAAIPLVMPNARRIRCIWHIVDRGWAKYAPGPKSLACSGNKSQYASISGIIKDWMYSWSRPDDCESRDEYEVSKALFVAFLNSNKVKEVFTSTGVSTLNDFLRNHVFPHEEYFCSYPNRRVFHLDTTSNTAHEGTNNGMKHCAARVLPTHTVNRTVRILSMNAEIKAGGKAINNARNATSRTLWSSLPTANKVTSLAEGLIINQWKERDKYDCHEAQHYQWLVKRTLYSSTSKSPIPRFQRIRKVHRLPNGSLLCSCCYFERVGIPCRHQLCVLCQVDNCYAGPSVHDIKVHWWKDYTMLAIKPNENVPNNNSRTCLFQLRDNDINGPACPDIPPKLEYAEPEESFNIIEWPAWKRLLNYSEQDGYVAFFSLFPSSNGLDTSAVASMTQETVLAGEDHEEDVSISFPAIVNVTTTQQSSYKVFDPLFKEIVSLLDGTGANCSEMVHRYENEVKELIDRLKSEVPVRANATQRVGRFASSNPESNKRRRTHGTSYGRR